MWGSFRKLLSCDIAFTIGLFYLFASTEVVDPHVDNLSGVKRSIDVLPCVGSIKMYE